MECRTTFLTKPGRGRGQRAYTVVELLIALGIGGLVLAVIGGIFLYSSRQFAEILNYMDLNSKGMRALDVMGRDIRSSAGLASYRADQLVLNRGSNLPVVTYRYDANQRLLTRAQGAGEEPVLTGIDWLTFDIYQRTPVAGTFDQYPVAVATNCKLVSVRWCCSRSLFNLKGKNSETAQEAKIVIRKH